MFSTRSVTKCSAGITLWLTPAPALPNLTLANYLAYRSQKRYRKVESIRKQLKGSSDKGFTLIELLVVVLILGILSVIAVVAVNNARSTAIQKACLASAQSYVSAYDQYVAQAASVTAPAANGKYSDAELKTLLVDGGFLKAVSTSTDYSLTTNYVAAAGNIAAHVTVAGSVANCSAGN